MDFETGIEHLQRAYWAIVVTSGPALGVALAAGLLIGIVQAATSINESTLSFVPKLALVLLTMALSAGFMLATLTDYFNMIFDSIRTVR
jgi:flagellar biosynthetic protein FliQ